MIYTYTPPLCEDPKRERIIQRNQQRSPLLRLPAELRTKIYKFTFSDIIVTVLDKSGQRIKPWEVKYEPKRQWRGALALLGTCRQIHHEASHLGNELCTFDITFTAYLAAGVRELGKDKCAAVRSLRIIYAQIMTLPDEDYSLVRHSFPCLQRMEIVDCPGSRLQEWMCQLICEEFELKECKFSHKK